MPELSVTDDQRERLRRVQEHLAEDVAYGHVRPRDALEYLLDRFDEESGSGTDSVEATATASNPSEGNADSSSGFVVRNGGTATASVQESVDSENDETDTHEVEKDAEARVLDASEGADAADTAGENGDDVAISDPSNESTETDDSGAASDSGDASDDARLNSVMSLLDDNADVWREAAGGEEKYEVDLPDGGTARARTKDDVRAVLFKHYR